MQGPSWALPRRAGGCTDGSRPSLSYRDASVGRGDQNLRRWASEGMRPLWQEAAAAARPSGLWTRSVEAATAAAHYQRLHRALHDPDMQLLAETDIETGLRWGELTELRPKDIEFATNTILVSRVVVHLKSAQHGGSRFKVKEYPKDREWRRVVIAPHLADKLRRHITRGRLGPDDLLFPLPGATAARGRRPAELPGPSLLGLTEPNDKGRSYHHGTLTAYQAGKCRCQVCRDALADYRARRRAMGMDTPRLPRLVQTDAARHISNDWFRHHVWNPAL